MSQKNHEDANNTFFSYYGSRSGRIFRLLDIAKARFLVKYVDNKKVILDFGCGTGKLSSVLLKGNNIVYGMDHDPRLLSMAKGKGLITVKSDFRKIPFDNNFFDVVMSVDSLEHVESREKTMAEIKRVLKPLGQFVVLTPAYDSVFWVIGEKIANFITGRKKSGHITPFTKESLAYLLKKNFSEIAVMRRINFNLGLAAVARNKK